MAELIHIVGIDVATERKKTGLALAEYSAGVLTLKEACTGQDVDSVAGGIARWINDRTRVLLAIDAPLGWPEPLGSSLFKHQAGEYISAEPNKIFSRLTDRKVKALTTKKPLDVGADRIARTAHAALKIVEELRSTKQDRKIEMCWNQEKPDADISMIEVYPAATLLMCGLPAEKYKNEDQSAERKKILDGLRRMIRIEDGQATRMILNADILDAVVCTVAGADFLNGYCVAPDEKEVNTAKKEGWIWVRRRILR